MSNSLYKKFIWFGLAVVLLITPALRGTVRILSITPVLIFIYTIAFVWLWRLNNQEMPKFKKTSLDIPIILFTLLALVSVVKSIYKYDSYYSFLKLLGYVGIFYVVVNNFDREMVKRMILLVIGVGTLLSVYGLLQYSDILPHPWWDRGFLSSTYVNHNHFSGYLELAIPVTIGTLLKEERAQNPVKKIILAGTLLVMVGTFILAQSRGAWISLGISLVVMVLFLLRTRKGLIFKSIIFGLILLVALTFGFIYFTKSEVSQRMETLTPEEIGEPSLQARIKIWKGTLAMIKEEPLLGTGIGTFVWGFFRFRPEGLLSRSHFAHNEFLHMAAEMGIAAPLIMLWMLGIIVYTGLIRRSAYLDIMGCSIGVLSLGLHGLVDFNFHITANMLLTVVFAGFIMAEY